MTWSVGLAALALLVVAGGAWFLGRPRAVTVRRRAPGRRGGRRATCGARTRSPPSPAATGWTRSTRSLDSLEARIAEHDLEIALLRGEAPATPGRPAAGHRRRRRPSSAGRGGQPPPRPGPAAGRDEPPAAGRPVPLRRSDLWAPLAYLLLAGWVTAGLIANLRTGYLSQGVQDQQAFEWYFGAAAHNLTSLSNPLFSDLQNFPAGVNLMANAAVLGLGIPLAPLTLLAGPSVDLPRRRAARPRAHGIRVVLAVPSAPGGAPARSRHRRGLRRLRARAWSRTPTATRTSSRSSSCRSSSTGCCGSRRPPPGAETAWCSGLLAAWQVFIGEEVLLLTAVGLAVAGVVYLAHG